ncbi:hypothetical protein L9F63_009092, partial [Diploptera punctata]
GKIYFKTLYKSKPGKQFDLEMIMIGNFVTCYSYPLFIRIGQSGEIPCQRNLPTHEVHP